MFGRFSHGPLISDIAQVSTGAISREKAVHVRTARVACANYRAILHDFPNVFGRDRCARDAGVVAAIDAWLLHDAALLSERQARSTEVNGPVDHAPDPRPAFRPPGYGRGIVVPVDAPHTAAGARYLDLKGAGVAPDRTPSHRPYSDGLEYLGYAIADFFYGWLVDTVFARSCPGYHVVPVYAVLDLGFDIVGGWHGTAPAGLHVRRAHARPPPGEHLPMSGSDRERLTLHAELLLRRYGLSTTGNGTAIRLAPEAGPDALSYRGMLMTPATEAERDKARRLAEAIRHDKAVRLELINVQAAAGGDWAARRLDMFDFGQVGGYRDFWNPFANLIRDGVLHIGRIVPPTAPGFVRPDPRMALDPELCARHTVNALGFYAAAAFRRGDPAFDATGIATLLRLGRLKAFRRDTGWAHDRIAAARDAA